MNPKIAFAWLLVLSLQVAAQNAPIVQVAQGQLQGLLTQDGLREFRGIPFAQPPVGPLRWQEPQPPLPWKGMRKADKFGDRAMQTRVYSDMIFRSDTISEDCLYLNVWAPPVPGQDTLPVLVYFYGGGFMAGDGSEPRYDGASMARRGIVTVTVNYRLGIFGFFAHPELTKASPHQSSGNYGLMDQHAALVWVHNNIKAFGGDPHKVTIAGESAGSNSVSCQVATPLSKGLFRGAIGESGSCLGKNPTATLSQAEAIGQQFVQASGAGSLQALRAMSANDLLELAHSKNARFPIDIDGYFFPESPLQIYSTGKQMDVPLLAGWNSAEVNNHGVFGNNAPSVSSLADFIQKQYGDKAPEVMKAYQAYTDSEAAYVGTDLSSDRFIAFATWKWIDLHGKTNGHPVYRYQFNQVAPFNPRPLGAPHASEIPYAMGNLPLIKDMDWTPDDYKTSEAMQSYFASFVKTGNPNTTGLPTWYGWQSSIPKVMYLGPQPYSAPAKHDNRYVLMDGL
jgi:para-nitrobenzyl esterase